MKKNKNKKENGAETQETERYNNVTKTRSAMKKGRINVVDICLFLCILAVVFVALSYFLPGMSTYFIQEEEYHVTYKIEFRGVDGDIDMTKIVEGMPVYDSVNNYEIGTVKGEISVEPYKILVNSDVKNEGGYNGELVAHPELKNIVVTVVGDAIYSPDDESFLIDGQRIAVGKQFSIRLGGFTGVGYCVSFDPYSN